MTWEVFTIMSRVLRCVYFISESVSTVFHLYFHEPQAVYFFHVEFPQALCLISFSLSACYDNLTCGFYNTEPKRTHDIWSHYCVTSTKLFFFFTVAFYLRLGLESWFMQAVKGLRGSWFLKNFPCQNCRKCTEMENMEYGEYWYWCKGVIGWIDFMDLMHPCDSWYDC